MNKNELSMIYRAEYFVLVLSLVYIDFLNYKIFRVFKKNVSVVIILIDF